MHRIRKVKHNLGPIALRNLPPEIARRIREKARRERINKAPHQDLGKLAGTWSDDEARAFDKALAEQRAVDKGLWKRIRRRRRRS